MTESWLMSRVLGGLDLRRLLANRELFLTFVGQITQFITGFLFFKLVSIAVSDAEYGRINHQIGIDQACPKSLNCHEETSMVCCATE